MKIKIKKKIGLISIIDSYIKERVVVAVVLELMLRISIKVKFFKIYWLPIKPKFVEMD